ncbi:DUF4302 domain-containing protein [Flavobacterium sp. A45]|uniref:DUF4302 domain-containing protein n=1 Tax=Flavobacterium sp. A45 TaxID=1945862 RepID=UPI000986E6F1|nr:DUF4302 domain-containing protein [Flavobacterium sp. A45]OOG77606.1 hypothetical protein B0E44_02350 [Flavobacterium sp. A45]
MKIKPLFKLLILAFLAIQLVSCDNNETEQKFDQTPTERLNAQKTELNNLLLSSEYGWKAVYFTDNTQLGGYTHLFKFKNGGLVDMASDFDSDTAIYGSEYQIQLGSTVSLVFTTKNRIHLLSDSDSYPTTALRGKGYKGDFQFLYYGQENGEIIFKTNRDFIELHFVKATAQDWADLPKNIDMIDNVIGAPTRPLFRLLETNDGTKINQFDFNFSDVTRFALANSIESGSNMSYNMGIAYTPTGITVNPAVQVGTQKLTNFIYDDVTGEFTATGTNNVTATIKYSAAPLIKTDDYKKLLDGEPQTVYGYIAAYLSTAPTNSPLCTSLLNEINATLPANQKLSRIQLYFNTPYGNYIEYRFSGGKPTIYHTVSTVENAADKTIVLINEYWDNGAAIIPEPKFLKAIDQKLLDPAGLYVKKEDFKIRFTNTVYTFTSASSPFRITTYGL